VKVASINSRIINMVPSRAGERKRPGTDVVRRESFFVER
jgi:hypothetical protein